MICHLLKLSVTITNYITMAEPSKLTDASEPEMKVGVPRVCPLTGYILGPPFTQEWHPKGYPVVDGKYFDTQTGMIVTIPPGDKSRMGGPPTLDVYWHNLGGYGNPDEFLGMRSSSVLGIEEYVACLGGFFKSGACKLHSLTVTTYSVNVLICADLTRDEIWKMMDEGGLHRYLTKKPFGDTRSQEGGAKDEEGHTGELFPRCPARAFASDRLTGAEVS